MVKHLEVNAYHLEKLSCIVKIIPKLLKNEWTQINYLKFCLHYLYRLNFSLNLKFVDINSLRYSACQIRT